MKETIHKKIHMLNARDNIIMTLINKTSNINIHTEINHNFKMLLDTLNEKEVDYNKLSKALIPSREEDKYEYAFLFNSKYFDNQTMFYGEEIINKILSIINKESTQSILAGDYVKLDKIKPDILKEMFLEKIEYINKCEYLGNDQFFIVYINNITKNQVNYMIDKLKSENFFVGVMNLKYSCRIKQYLSVILYPICIKHKNKVIIAELPDQDDTINLCEQNGFKVISINQMLYDLFLSYKIPNGIRDEEDLKFSYLLLTHLAPEYEDLKIVVDDDKLEYVKKHKNGSMKNLELLNVTKEELEKKILINIYNNYIYNIQENEQGIFMFNVLIELPVNNNKAVKNALIALKYIPDKNEFRLVTMF